jgi:hypothetical protein
VRFPVTFFFALATVFGQSAATTIYTSDLNGERQAATSVTTSAPGETTRTELSQSLNGRTVPLEQTEERVLRKDASGSLTEKIVRKYDPAGRLMSTQRTVTEEQIKPGGASTITAKTYGTDLNGDQHETERRVSNVQVSGSNRTEDTSIQRPSINGSFETAEKRATVSAGDDNNKTTTETVYRAGPGGFAEALKTVTTSTKSGDTTVEHTAEYEPLSYGQLQLHGQTVATTTKQPDGSEITQLNIYANSADGTVQQAGSPQQVKEQQIITRHKAADGSVIQRVSVRRPTLDNPNHLGSAQQISETVCTGKCS